MLQDFWKVLELLQIMLELRDSKIKSWTFVLNPSYVYAELLIHIQACCTISCCRLSCLLLYPKISPLISQRFFSQDLPWLKFAALIHQFRFEIGTRTKWSKCTLKSQTLTFGSKSSFQNHISSRYVIIRSWFTKKIKIQNFFGKVKVINT